MSDWPYPHFSKKELMCKCGCGKLAMNDDFLERLEIIREQLGFPLYVTSGYRCPEHDRAVGGSSSPGGGPHTTGKAVDIAITGEKAFQLISEAVYEGIRGIGVSQRGGKPRFIHLDMIDTPTRRPRIWSY